MTDLPNDGPAPTRCKISRIADTWPQNDQAAWLLALKEGDPIDPGGLASGWAPLSCLKAETDYGRWLDWLDECGELDPAVDPAARTTKDRVRRYIAHLQSNLSPYTVQSVLQSLGEMLRVTTNTHDHHWIGRAAGRLRGRATSSRNKRERMKSPDQLVDLGVSLMKQADLLLETDPRRAAMLFRDGLMITLMAYRPLRLHNFMAIVLGQHLVQRAGSRWLVFTAVETKPRTALECPFPAFLEAPLDRYLAIYRPIMIANGARIEGHARHLWVSRVGDPFSAKGVAAAIKLHTKRAFGLAINPHLFRDCAATMIATVSPEYVHDITVILGHSTLATSARHYNQARSLDAGRRGTTRPFAMSGLPQSARANSPRLPTGSNNAPGKGGSECFSNDRLHGQAVVTVP